MRKLDEPQNVPLSEFQAHFKPYKSSLPFSEQHRPAVGTKYVNDEGAVLEVVPGGKDPNQIFFREQGDDRRFKRYWTGNHAQSFNSYLLGGNYRL